MLRLLAFIPVLSFLGCMSSHKKYVEDGPNPPEKYKPSVAVQLTQVGENTSGRFSPDDKRILFVSRKRPHHAQAQVYERNLEKMRERRVTFNEADAASPTYDDDGARVLYSSATDELKEHPEFLEKTLQRINGNSDSKTQKTKPSIPRPDGTFGPYEVYISSVRGSDIKRLTKSRHFDGDPTIHPSGDKALYSTIQNGQLDIFSIDLKTQKTKAFASSKAHETEPVYSPSGDFVAWVRFSPDNKTSDILVADADGDNMQVITMKDAIHWSPQWSPDGQEIIFSSNLSQTNNFELYMISKDGECLSRLTYTPGNDLLPAFSRDGSEIIFTSDRSGTKQLYKMPFTPPPVCLK